jgi:hypothetical protein
MLSTSTGSGYGVALYPTGNRALIAASVYSSIFGIDLSTGARSVISDANTGSGGVLGWPYDIEANTAFTQYIVASQRPAALLTLNPTNGNRTVIASDTVGTGSALGDPYAVTLQPGGTSVWVGDSLGVLDVNLASGNRSRLLSTTSRVTDLALNTANDRLLLIDRTNPSIKAMNLTTHAESVFVDGAIGTGQHFSYPRSAAYDPSGNVVYIGDSGAIHRVEVDTGNRTLVSSSSNMSPVGTGSPIYEVNDITLDMPGNRLYLANRANILSVDLLDGDRTIVSSSTVGTGPAFTKASGLVMDIANQKAWFVDYELAAVLQVDLVTGNRVVLSGSANGTGPLFAFPYGIVRDTVNDRLLVGDQQDVVAVDLSTGDRTILSGASNSGPALNSIRELSLDASRNRVLVVNNSASMTLPVILAVDLTTGNRTVVSQAGAVGTGPIFRDTQGLAVDGANDRVFVLDSGDGTNSLVNTSLQTGDRVIVSQ